MKKRYIPLNAKALLTPSFKSADAFADLVEDFLTRLPTFAPGRWGVIEPINLSLSMPEIRDFLQSGSSDIMWKRNVPPKGWGIFRKRTNPLKGPQLASHYLDVSVGKNDQVLDLISYMSHLSRWAGVEYAHCDTLSLPYVDIAHQNGLAPYKNNISIYTYMLVKALPDVMWFQIFGPAYVRLIGLDKILSAPAYKVEQLGPETVSVQLSESLFDLHDRYDEVEIVRKKVKQHLDDNIFFDPRNEKDHVYRVPQFEFPE
jgi:hypothetical protein